MRIHERRGLSRRALTIAGVAITLAGCSTPATFDGDIASTSPKPAHDARLLQRDGITAEQIATISVQNAYDAVLRLRPALFMAHQLLTSVAPVAPCAIIANGRPEPLEALKLIPAEQVLDIQLIPPREAVTEHGAACPGGVLKVRLAGVATKRD